MFILWFVFLSFDKNAGSNFAHHRIKIAVVEFCLATASAVHFLFMEKKKWLAF